MVSQFESAIVRVFGSDKRVVGTGFLITSTHIVTCCHVINQALNQADSILPPRESIFIDFPFLEREQFFSARVVHWLPKKGSSGDIAVLMLETSKPEKVEPVAIVTNEELTGRNVRTHGFPLGYEDDGRPALSVIVGLLAGGRLSIQGTSSYGLWVEGGFSGAPVWDDAFNAVVGMVVTVDTGVERSASIIPASMFSQYSDVSQSRRDDTDILGAVGDYSLGSTIRSVETGDSFVFISYSHDDGEDIAKLLHDALERNGCRVWIDYKDLAGNPGVDWDDEIDRAIEHCGTFVAVVTPLALTSMEVRGEWRLAQDERKSIVPAIRQPVRVPRNFRLLQWIDLTNRVNAGSEIAKLVRKLGCSDGNGGNDVPLPTPPITEPDFPNDLSSKKIVHIDQARAYAMELLRKRDYARLIKWSHELDTKLQEDADILALRAVAQDAIGNVKDALDDYSKAIQLDPQDANLYIQRASLNVDVGNVRDAFEDFEKALKLNPDLQEIIDTETAAIVIFVREPDQLPMPLFDEIEGRTEISALARHTLQTGERVLFYGIGGIGKTALSTVIAREYLAEKQTVLWVNVGSARLETLLNAIGQELERALKGKAFKGAESVEQKTTYISNLLKRENLLLILDDAWNPEETKQFLISVVPPGCPTIVTTRRTDFDDIPGLIKLNLAELSREAAVNLYQAINENDRDRHAVEELCRILGFHPLAIRLAALMGKNTGVGVDLTLRQLKNAHIKNPVRAIFDAVIENAAEDNRKVFIVIGALPVTRVTDEFVALILDESVEAVAAKSRYLADQGLINPTISPEGEAFYAVHDLTYAYAHDLMLEQGKHAALEHKVVEAACEYVAQHKENFSKLALERPTLIASITRAKGYQDHTSIYVLVDGLLTFLDYQGYFVDYLNVLSIASETAETQQDKRKQARYWNELATIFVKLGRYKQAVQYFEMALVVSREFGDRRSEGSIIGNLANVYVSLGKSDRAIDYYEQALPLSRAVGDQRSEATTLSNIGATWDALGEKRKALDYYEQALHLSRAVGDRRSEVNILSNTGAIWDTLGERRKALDYYKQALPISRVIGDRRGEANILSNIGTVWDALGEKRKALDFYEQALPLFRAIGDLRGEGITLNNIGEANAVMGLFNHARDYYEQAIAIFDKLNDTKSKEIARKNIQNMQSKIRVYLSYARVDDEAFVERLYHDLKDEFDVWWDRVSMPNRGLTFLQEIQYAIDRADKFLLIIGLGALKSDYVRAELEYAYGTYKGINLVLRMGDYSDLPERLRSFDAPDFRDDANYYTSLQRLKRQLAEPVASIGVLHNVPALPPHFLSSHHDALDALHELVIANVDKPTLIGPERRTTVVAGVGGIGKSVLVSAFAHDRKVRFAFPDGIVWLNVGRDAIMYELYRAVGVALGDELGNYPDEITAHQNAQKVLLKKKCLIILDDVWDFPVTRAFNDLISGTAARLLITTRKLHANDMNTNVYHLRSVDKLQAINYLRSWIGDDPHLETIAEKMGYLFLALKVAGAHMKEYHLSGAEYLRMFDRVSRMKISRHALDRDDSLELSLKLSYDALDGDTQRRFRALGVFAVDDIIDIEMLVTVWDDSDESDVKRALVELVNANLLEPNEVPGRYTQHDLLREYARNLLEVSGEYDAVFARFTNLIRGGSINIGSQQSFSGNINIGGKNDESDFEGDE